MPVPIFFILLDMARSVAVLSPPHTTPSSQPTRTRLRQRSSIVRTPSRPCPCPQPGHPQGGCSTKPTSSHHPIDTRRVVVAPIQLLHTTHTVTVSTSLSLWCWSHCVERMLSLSRWYRLRHMASQLLRLAPAALFSLPMPLSCGYSRLGTWTFRGFHSSR